MGISMQKIRRGVELIETRFQIHRFLLSDQLRARKGNLLIEILGQYLNVGLGGAQAELPEIVEAYLHRISYEDGVPVGLYPITRPGHPQGPRRVVILPDVGFGKPVTKHKYISTAVIADRFRAGESVVELAEDYRLDTADIEEAIRTQSVELAIAA